jgi:uncharacterized OsmC-like protein
MTITMEECGELTQQCSKIMRKYKDFADIEEDQRHKLIEEAGDVYCMLELMIEHKVCKRLDLEDRANVKKKKLEKWSNLIV